LLSLFRAIFVKAIKTLFSVLEKVMDVMVPGFAKFGMLAMTQEEGIIFGA
jgi:hypothetical protein